MSAGDWVAAEVFSCLQSSGENLHGLQLVNLFLNPKGMIPVGFQFHTAIKSDSNLSCHFSRAESLLLAKSCARRRNGIKTFQQSQPLAHGSWLRFFTWPTSGIVSASITRCVKCCEQMRRNEAAGRPTWRCGVTSCNRWSLTVQEPSHQRLNTHFGFVLQSCQTLCLKCHTSARPESDVSSTSPEQQVHSLSPAMWTLEW